MEAASTCVVCGGPLTDPSREDIFPQWLQRELGLRRARARPMIVGSARTDWGTYGPDNMPELVAKRTGIDVPLSGLLLGGVCAKKCNNGWMSDLETQNRDIILPLVSRARSFADLTESERNTLARWVLKTGLTVQLHFPPDRMMIPMEHAQLLAKRDVPRGTALFGTTLQHDQPTFLPVVDREWPVLSRGALPVDVMSEYILSTYKVTLWFRQLCLTLSYTPPHPEWRLATWPRVHRLVLNAEAQVEQSKWRLDRPDPLMNLDIHFSLGLSHGPFQHTSSLDDRGPDGRHIFDHEGMWLRKMRSLVKFAHAVAADPDSESPPS